MSQVKGPGGGVLEQFVQLVWTHCYLRAAIPIIVFIIAVIVIIVVVIVIIAVIVIVDIVIAHHEIALLTVFTLIHALLLEFAVFL